MNQLIESLKNHPVFNGKTNFNLVKCPGRISFSKHCDYVNNDLLYIAADYSIYAASAALHSSPKTVSQTFKIKIINLNDKFSDFELIFHKNHEQNEEDLEKHKSNWYFYVLKLVNELIKGQPKSFSAISELDLAFNNDLPAAGGMSSSHALILSTMLSLSISLKIDDLHKKITKLDNKNDTLEILKLCQRIEHSKGFKSGLGDQAAQLLSKKNKFCFIKLYPELSYSYIDIPDHLAFMILPSYIKAEKTSKEYLKKPKYFKNYSKLNEYWFDFLKKEKDFLNKFPDKEIFHLGELLYLYEDKYLLKKISQIPEEDLRYLSLYALAEGARLKSLKNNFSDNKLYSHINFSHLAENINQETYELQENIDFIKPLSEHIGAYRASTGINDELCSFSLDIAGVYACSIMGAGLGGNNLAIVEKDKTEKIKNFLLENFYSPKELAHKAEKGILVNTSSSALEQII